MTKIRGQNNKQTQGYKKLKQYTDDLVRNEIFLKKLKKFKEDWDQYWGYDEGDNEVRDRVDRLVQEYQSMLWEFEELNQEWEVLKASKEFAIEYALDSDLLLEMASNLSDKEKGQLLESFDFCEINDNNEEYV